MRFSTKMTYPTSGQKFYPNLMIGSKWESNLRHLVYLRGARVCAKGTPGEVYSSPVPQMATRCRYSPLPPTPINRASLLSLFARRALFFPTQLSRLVLLLESFDCD